MGVKADQALRDEKSLGSELGTSAKRERTGGYRQFPARQGAVSAETNEAVHCPQRTADELGKHDFCRSAALDEKNNAKALRADDVRRQVMEEMVKEHTATRTQICAKDT